MHYLGRALAAFVAVTAAGCIKLESFNCAQSSECQNGDVPGTCEAGGLCSFPDPLCPSGKKFGDFAGDQSGQCVGDGGSTGTSNVTTSLTTSASATGNSGTTFEPTTDPSASTTTAPSTATTDLTVTSATTVTSDTTTTTLTTDPGTTTAPDTTTGPTCGEVGEACVDGACCGSCSVCQDGTCKPADADMAEMLCDSPCMMCGGDGYCSPVPADVPCKTDCQDIVWQAVVEGAKTTCYSYAPLALASMCDGRGTCKLPTPEMCPEPGMMMNSAVPIVTCDSVCVQVPVLCSQGLPADKVTPSPYCALGFETPGCKVACTPDKLAVDPASCDGVGACVHGNLSPCDPYYCDGEKDICLFKCSGDEQCISGQCQGMKCQ